MTETIVNLIQLVVLGVCICIGLYHTVTTQKNTWAMLSLFYIVFFLGDLYWVLFLAFYGQSPSYSYISDVSWYSSILFLYLLLKEFWKDEEIKRYKAAWGAPVFTVAMCLFFMQRGDYASNTAIAVLMGMVLGNVINGLLNARAGADRPKGMRTVCLLLLLFCMLEYAEWVLSCFWMGDTMANPYFWCDLMITAVFLLAFPAVRKAVGR